MEPPCCGTTVAPNRQTLKERLLRFAFYKLQRKSRRKRQKQNEEEERKSRKRKVGELVFAGVGQQIFFFF